jgi:hypothetical protein
MAEGFALRLAYVIKWLMKILKLLSLVLIVTGIVAQAEDHFAIYESAFQDAITLEHEAAQSNRYHKAYVVTERIAEQFLATPEVQANLVRRFPDPNDRIAYQYGFLMWIRHEIAKRE